MTIIYVPSKTGTHVVWYDKEKEALFMDVFTHKRHCVPITVLEQNIQALVLAKRTSTSLSEILKKHVYPGQCGSQLPRRVQFNLTDAIKDLLVCHVESF